MDPSEPKRKSPTEEAVDAHHHVHVEIPGKKHCNLMKQKRLSPNMAQAKALAVKDHDHPSHLGSLLLHDQLEQGEDSSEEVKERHLAKVRFENTTLQKREDIDGCRPPVVATGPA